MTDRQYIAHCDRINRVEKRMLTPSETDRLAECVRREKGREDARNRYARRIAA